MRNEIIFAETAILLSRVARLRRDGGDALGLLSALLLAASIVLGILWRESGNE